ncbi:hypothetical protein U9K52_18580 [Chryseobacterium sp. MHB01]|uniref:hypothetical protein n=1 Tax=Chryseobacterium sp. MHB01 TaxID=3109433 RepID=UPI002AFF641E|nr:hypothetical protein [Chryseobacterium sp. MHB01]MEA1850925.1 hypothetical protein [Chryseobacterium sp. MHB01]
MKKLMTIFTVLLSTILYCQDIYQNGFSAGYKAGYCYNILGCIAPISPIGDRDIKNDYQTGYNNGFVKGQQDQKHYTTQHTPTGGAYGQVKPAVQELDLSIDTDHMRDLWADYYEKRRIKKQKKIAEKQEKEAKISQLIIDRTTEVIDEIDKLKKRLKANSMNDAEIDKIITNFHYENQTLYNKYKDNVKKYGDFYVENEKLKEKISKL